MVGVTHIKVFIVMVNLWRPCELKFQIKVTINTNISVQVTYAILNLTVCTYWTYFENQDHVPENNGTTISMPKSYKKIKCFTNPIDKLSEPGNVGNLFFKCFDNKEYTSKSVYKGHSREPLKVARMDRLPLFTCSNLDQ